MKKITCILIIVLFNYELKSQIISTIAGNGYYPYGYSGDGGLAINAEFWYPMSVAVDLTGNVYIADSYNNRIRKINTSGIITTFAGDSIQGYSGDGGLSNHASLNHPYGVSTDAAGNVYIVDEYNQCIRKVNTGGIIATIAGNGTYGFSGDGAAATNAELGVPYNVTTDALGNLYIVDSYNHRIRKVSTSGIISTFAGNGVQGYTGDGGYATNAELNYPEGVAVDFKGNVYIADSDNQRIRKVSANGIITTFAGIGTRGMSGDGGVATNAQLGSPSGITTDTVGNLYISDAFNNNIRKVDANGIISTIAGNGTQGYSGDGGLAINAALYSPTGVAVDYVGNIFIADLGNNRIRKISVNTTTITERIPDRNEQLIVYPNPSKSIIKIELIDNNKIIEASLLDLFGKEILKTSIEYIDLENLPEGVYFLMVKTGKSILTKKIIVQH